jgi:hypothetical protein
LGPYGLQVSTGGKERQLRGSVSKVGMTSSMVLVYKALFPFHIHIWNTTVGGMGAGRRGGTGARAPVACSHRAQGDLCVRPTNGLGSGECLRLGMIGVAGTVVDAVLRLGQVRCNMTKSQMRANRAR